jgi:hypothetical protein
VLKNLQLVFDCTEPDEIMRFWGRALHYNNQFVRWTAEEITEWRKGFPQFDGRGRMDDDDGRRMAIYIQKVPEPKAVRNRLRPEIAVPDIASFTDDVVALGGRKLDDQNFEDVEGNEFTVIEGGTERRLSSIEIDAVDPVRLLAFWVDATGYVASGNRCDPPPGARYVLPFSDGEARELDLIPGLRFVATDEPKRVKNRLHLDLQDSEAEATRDRLVAAGATVLQWDSENVLADPEGNEFCCG